jgi:hypothetical protein
MIERGGVQHLAALNHGRRGGFRSGLIVRHGLAQCVDRVGGVGALSVQLGQLGLPGRRLGFLRQLAYPLVDGVQVLLRLGHLSVQSGQLELILVPQQAGTELEKLRGQRLGSLNRPSADGR